MTELHFWATGYWVSTVGRDEEAVRKYVREQEAWDQDQAGVVRVTKTHNPSPNGAFPMRTSPSGAYLTYKQPQRVSGGQGVSHFGGVRRATALGVDRGHALPGMHSGAASQDAVP